MGVLIQLVNSALQEINLFSRPALLLLNTRYSEIHIFQSPYCGFSFQFYFPLVNEQVEVLVQIRYRFTEQFKIIPPLSFLSSSFGFTTFMACASEQQIE